MGSSFDLRETRVYAREIKFVIDTSLASEIQQWMRANLEPDENGTGPFGDEYATSSLYFETPKFDVFHRRGSYGRSKYRIRRYGLADSMFLERKFRTDRLLASAVRPCRSLTSVAWRRMRATRSGQAIGFTGVCWCGSCTRCFSFRTTGRLGWARQYGPVG
jgi:hypothetical protein